MENKFRNAQNENWVGGRVFVVGNALKCLNHILINIRLQNKND